MKHQTGEIGWRSGILVTYFTLMPDCQRSLRFKLRRL